MSLERSRFQFNSIPALIAHYAQCCDELPVQLLLPRTLRDSNNRQQLSSLALLGQEFWRYPMSCPKPQSNDVLESKLLDAKSPNSLSTETSGLGNTVFSSNSGSGCVALNGHAGKIFSPTAGTPSDNSSCLSSFSNSGAAGAQHMQLMSPESIDSVILTMSPVDAMSTQDGVTNSLSTFKSNGITTPMPFKSTKVALKPLLENGINRPQRPKPPNTLNLDLRKPPAPPLRLAKPLTPSSPLTATEQASNNFTVTTTVTFSMDNSSNASQFVEVTTPASNPQPATVAASSFQTFAKRLSPEGECKDTLSSQGSSSNGSRWQSSSQNSKDSNQSQQRKILSPCLQSLNAAGAAASRTRKSKAHKESKHYQECDILESPQIYCQSALGDKISDYEDLWSPNNERAALLSSFKPLTTAADMHKRPDLIAGTPTPLPTASSAADNNADTQQLIQFSADAQPRSRAGLLLPALMTQSLNEEQLLKTEDAAADVLAVGDSGKPTCTAATAAAADSRSKQGSPFYAEPADALRQAGLNTASILRRTQRATLLPANHRHSEPPKTGSGRTPICALLATAEMEKIAGSLDELKKKQQLQQQQQQQQQAQPQQQPTKRARGRFEQWPLDDSWEFMSKQQQQQQQHEDEYCAASQSNKENAQSTKPKPITVHQLIAKRLPDLNLPELVRCSTPTQQSQHNHNKHLSSELLAGSQRSFDSCRLSSYDNLPYTQNNMNNEYEHSDDGTVFSEPWDSSRWDFLPTDDGATNNSDTIHLSKCRVLISEDETIVDEELSTKESSEDTLKAKKTNHIRQKVATILRNPSMRDRDRDILCHPRNKIISFGAGNVGNGPDAAVRLYTLQLAQDASSTFSRTIQNFISCTKDSRETDPQKVMRNMRQFMNGMKNYLVKHGEGKFQQEVEAARARLKADEFLNLDYILETVMHQLVVLPLREHLNGMFVEHYMEDIQKLAENVKYASERLPIDFGIRASVLPPAAQDLQQIYNAFVRLQEAELPLDKLQIFMSVITQIYDATKCPQEQLLGADDFLPVMIYVVAKCGFVSAEIETEFMFGLLQQTLLIGEPGYYLTTLSSAVGVLKKFMADEHENGNGVGIDSTGYGSLDWRSVSLPTCSSVLRVIIPDECSGSLQCRILPVRPHTTSKEVCRTIAHKARITNPQDYALFQVINGEETMLADAECPQNVRANHKGKTFILSYKRIDAKIGWPTATQPV